MTYKVSADKASALRLNERGAAAVLQNIAVLLATKQGTVSFYREFGLP